MNKEIKVLDTFKISDEGIYLKQYHIDRTIEAFEFLKSDIHENKIHAVYNQVEDRSTHLKSEMKGRIEFNIESLKDSVCEISPMDTLPQPLTLELARLNLQLTGTGIENYKTSERKYWADVMAQAHCYDVIGINKNGFITETSRFNLFLLADDKFYTPALSSGCINGVLRRYYFDQNYIHFNNKNYEILEKEISASELKSYKIYVGNSVRGLREAMLL